MGALISFFSSFAAGQEKRVLCLGLDNAGKSTVLNRLHLGENLMTIPTVGFNVETVTYKSLTMTIWDVGGQHRIRPLWKHYYRNTDSLIYVVDASDRERIEEAGEELHRVLSSDLLQNINILVLANKMDLPNALNAKAIANGLHLNKEQNRRWFVQPTIATKGEGLYEGLDWMAKTVPDRSSV